MDDRNCSLALNPGFSTINFPHSILDDKILALPWEKAIALWLSWFPTL
jgi:hypothetical protein